MIGLGNTAQRVIQRLSPFGCRILAHHPRRTAESIRAAGAQPTSLTELLQQSDIVSLHVPLTNETRHLINEQALSQMKPGAMLINTSRGAVIDEAALIRALQRDHLYGVALDVYEQEPLPLDHPLLQFDPQRVILSPHFAGGSQEALPAQQQEVANAITAFLQGHWPASTINPTVIPKTGVHLLRRR
jgi:phosphoglycerate dehydrogenase-like enzyme